MSSEDNKATVRRLFDEVVTLGHLHIADELFASDFVFHDPVTEKYTGWGSPQVKHVVETIRTAFPDIGVNIEAQLAAEGNLIVTQWSATGTHTGQIGNVPAQPTGERVEVSGMSVSRFNEGHIEEIWLMHDPDEPRKNSEGLWEELCKHCRRCCG